ncbi:class III lanthionine synthetase LanKC N-terminal domain-containing protein [Streptomyces sp. NBC_00239]|uniref:class III lanthionine synthetase LanKC N-terminal domain-containing protein n=1 Tax=Streptomyces sp. NBC_00239 TaxID=2903640 RepID=UPI003FA79816
MRHEVHPYVDDLFGDPPVRWATRGEFSAVGAPLPAGWRGATRGAWVDRRPDGVELPHQGWKIHVSAYTDNAEHVLAVVTGYCFFHRVTFTFLRSPALLETQKPRYASRGAGGTFMTLYPVDEPALEQCLDSLDALLSGQPGPPVVNDLRWRSGPLYVRYGAFPEPEQHCRPETDEPLLGPRRTYGALRPDVRRAAFGVPDGATVPAVLAEALADRDTAGRRTARRLDPW